MADCLPWWRDQFLPYQGRNRRIVKATSTDPESMRAAAEATLRRADLFQSVSQDHYTLARYISSEVGTKNPETKVAVAQCAVNRAKLLKMRGVSQLLLYQGPYAGQYGPIDHGQYRRWASTALDPGYDDFLIADFVLKGGAPGFNKGGDDQIGAEVTDDYHAAGWALNQLPVLHRRNDYWVGPLPGVDHWVTFITQHRPDVPQTSVLGQKLIAAGTAALSSGARPSYVGWPTCEKGILDVAVENRAPLLVCAALGGGLLAGWWIGKWQDTGYG
jgi:hypothetical protein